MDVLIKELATLVKNETIKNYFEKVIEKYEDKQSDCLIENVYLVIKNYNDHIDEQEKITKSNETKKKLGLESKDSDKSFAVNKTTAKYLW